MCMTVNIDCYAGGFKDSTLVQSKPNQTVQRFSDIKSILAHLKCCRVHSDTVRGVAGRDLALQSQCLGIQHSWSSSKPQPTPNRPVTSPHKYVSTFLLLTSATRVYNNYVDVVWMSFGETVVSLWEKGGSTDVTLEILSHKHKLDFFKGNFSGWAACVNEEVRQRHTAGE